MKTTHTLRILAGLSFLIFFCPFLTTCTFEKVAVDEPLTTNLPKEQVTEQNDSAHESDRGTVNFYELTGKSISNTFKGLKVKDLIDADFYLGLLEPAIVVLAFVLLIASLYKKHRLAFIAAAINVALLLLFTFLIYNIRYGFEPFRYGYYLFVLNSIALIFVSYKAKKQPNHAV